MAKQKKLSKKEQLDECPKCKSGLSYDDFENTGSVIIARVVCENSDCDFSCSELFSFVNWEADE